MRQYFINSLIIFILLNTLVQNATAQDAPADGAATPLSGNSMAASRFESTPVNYYTGIPSISIPLFNYSNQNGLSLGMTLDYSAGGIRVGEASSTAGLGWSVNVGGTVVRNIRGMPDDYPQKGFLYSPVVPLNFQSQARKYYYDSLDAQQDIFQFSINGRSGKFFIGKNNQIVTIPLSKLRISYDTSSGGRINSFTIVDESGVKYLFSDIESANTTYHNFKSGFNHEKYYNAWNLTYVVAPFSRDTIKLTYHRWGSSRDFLIGLNAYISGGNITEYETSTASQSISSGKILNILFPDHKKITFVYDPDVKYDDDDFALNSIHIGDSIFRFGYQFQWADSGRTVLAGLRSYTNTYIKPGYRFFYNVPVFPYSGAPGDTLYNKRDHWGFYNANVHDTNSIPTVAGIYTGVNREPSAAATAATLSTIVDPSGGKTFYTFENNDIYRLFNMEPQHKRPNCKTYSNTVITLQHVVSSKDSFSLSFSGFSPLEDYPFSGSGFLICSITNADSTVVYATDSVNMYDMFNQGHASLVFNNIPDSNYKFRTRLSAGTTVWSQKLYVNINWNNEIPVTTNKTQTGGIRIKQIAHFDPVTGRTDTVSTYKYELVNGRSSGFLGAKPSYHRAHMDTYFDGPESTTSEYTVISSNAVNDLNYIQGSPVGYSRVEVIKGSYANNLGKEVYEYTTLTDADDAVHAQIFPYTPKTQRDWALGLCKKVSVFDSAGNLIQETVNNYNTITQSYNDSAFRSLKLGLTGKVYSGTSMSHTLLFENFASEFYYPESGRSDLINTTQTFHYTDNSVQVKSQEVVYDSNYNAVKMISSYDLTRGLSLERRMYYPYNYTIGGTIGTLRDSGIYTVVATEDWITGDSIPRMVAASATDFTQLGTGYIKPTSLYALQSKAPVPQSTIGTFDSSVLVRNTGLIKKQQEFVSYDSAGNCLEVRDFKSGISNVIIMDYASRIPVAKISNSSITDVAYTSFESDGTGNWSVHSLLRIDSGITGKKSYDLSNGFITKGGLSSGMTYIISYWKQNAGSVSISGAANITFIAEQNGWKLYTQTVSSATSVTVSGSGTIDELRLYPKDANMSTSTFEPLIGVTSTCDANNTITYYEYDSANRLIVVRDKDLNVLKKHEYSDSLIHRNFNSPAKKYMARLVKNGSSHVSHCKYYWRYQEGMMSDEYVESDPENCPQWTGGGDPYLPD